MPHKTIQMFDQMFPQAAQHFDTRLEGKVNRNLTEWEWQHKLEADTLTVFAASHRQDNNLFDRIRFALRFYNYQEIIKHMVARKDEKRKDSDVPEWKGFLDRKLDDAELETLDGWKPKPTDIWDAVDALITQGYRITLSYNKKTKLASVTLIDNRENSAFAGYALASADTDGALALKTMIFKHFTVLGEDWRPIADSTPRAKRG